MPATKKITKEMISKAAMDIFRSHGLQAVTSRRVAQKLGCSTQPLYIEYKSMDDLKSELIRIIVKRQDEMYDGLISQSTDFLYRSYGMAFLRFAQTEPFLFRHIYILDGSLGKHIDEMRLPKMFEILENEYGYSRSQAEAIHETASTYLMGVSAFISSGYRQITEEQMNSSLTKLFVMICSLHGLPPKLMNTEQFKTYYEEIKKKAFL
ncbi:MAG: TetR/AcrR family transcriptional regulator [Treponema sp.]|nr:TetR/AcrR family transcriptional regulator [Treponema sp.]